MALPKSVFADHHDEVWNYRYRASLHIVHMSGGVPNDPKVIKGWLTTRLLGQEGRDAELAGLVAKTAIERGIKIDADGEGDWNAAIEATVPDMNINGFKKIDGQLVFEGRCAKAALKEWFSVSLGSGKIPKGNVWGATGKGMAGFIAEHVQVAEEFIPLCRPDGTPFTEPDSITQRFVSTWRGQGISYSETLDEAVMTFTVECDWDLNKHWPTVWVEGEKQGIGSMRSQGSGKFALIEWQRLRGGGSKAAEVDIPPSPRPAKKAATKKAVAKRSAA